MEKTINLKEFYNVKGGTLKCLTSDYPFDDSSYKWSRPAVIVVGGGAYAFVSLREGLNTAYQFLARGYQTFMLTYLTATEGVSYPEELHELASSVDWVKKHAEEFYVNPDEIFVVGFSAGGHLTANLAVDYLSVGKELNIDCKITAAGLCYPVITNNCAYKGTHDNLLKNYTESEKTGLLQKLNLENAVDKNTCPCFIWTTADDDLVPAENSLVFALALARNNISYELHVYPHGYHGGACCNAEVNFGSNEHKRNERWVDDCATFFRLYCKEGF